MQTVKNLGSIELSGTIVVSDPCYDRDVWCMKTGLSVKPGRYDVMAICSDEKEWGPRIASLVLIHQDHKKAPQKNWESIATSIGVDSGQCGIFDDSIYPQSKDHPDYNPTFYEECCQITLSKKMAGLLKCGKGVVSSSGYGDGSYELFTKSDGGQNIALMLDYDLLKMRKIMQMLVAEQSKG